MIRTYGSNDQTMIAPSSQLIDWSVVRVICFATLLSVLSVRAAAEEFTAAIHAYLQQTVDAAKKNDCIVVGIVDEQGNRVFSCGKLDNGTG